MGTVLCYIFFHAGMEGSIRGEERPGQHAALARQHTTSAPGTRPSPAPHLEQLPGQGRQRLPQPVGVDRAAPRRQICADGLQQLVQRCHHRVRPVEVRRPGRHRRPELGAVPEALDDDVEEAVVLPSLVGQPSRWQRCCCCCWCGRRSRSRHRRRGMRPCRPAVGGGCRQRSGCRKEAHSQALQQRMQQAAEREGGAVVVLGVVTAERGVLGSSTGLPHAKGKLITGHETPAALHLARRTFTLQRGALGSPQKLDLVFPKHICPRPPAHPPPAAAPGRPPLPPPLPPPHAAAAEPRLPPLAFG